MTKLKYKIIATVLSLFILLSSLVLLSGCEKERKYEVTFMIADSIVVQGESFKVNYKEADSIKIYDEELIGNKAPDAEYQNSITYTFAGWYTEKECINSWNLYKDEVESNVTLYAKYVKN